MQQLIMNNQIIFPKSLKSAHTLQNYHTEVIFQETIIFFWIWSLLYKSDFPSTKFFSQH